MNCTITLSPLELHRSFQAMSRHGGGFCAALAQAWFKADGSNKRRIEGAFPHLLADFGPESQYYSEISI